MQIKALLRHFETFLVWTLEQAKVALLVLKVAVPCPVIMPNLMDYLLALYFTNFTSF